MKLNWKDIITTLVALAGGSIVYAKFYDYPWAVIGSWRSAVAVLAGTGLVMALFSRFDFSNFSFLNVGEMVFGIAAVGLAAVGIFMTSSFIFYSLASVLGALWLVDTARHAAHSLDGGHTYHPAH
ncbi:MAG: hypothetical protein WC498_03875 [Candidatus Saccharimonadales bacterium]